MGTIDKALHMLDVLSRLSGEAGLTELAELASMDSATARRFLLALERHGYVEHLCGVRKYRLGAAPLRLARIRETRYPLLRSAIPYVDRLAEDVGETVHLSEYDGRSLSIVYVRNSTQANRVAVDVGSDLPLHATASGIAFLATQPDQFVDDVLSCQLLKYTEHTVTAPELIKRAVFDARLAGFSYNKQGLDIGVISTAAAFIGSGGSCIGAISIAAPVDRVSERKVLEFGSKVAAAARDLSTAMSGEEVPERR